MNPLDQLLTATRPVPDISPDGLRNGQIALDAALSTSLGAPVAGASQTPRRRVSGVRAKALIGTAMAAAGAAAAATVITMPSSPTDPAGSSSEPVQIAPTNLTAAMVLDQAARAAGSQAGWPNAQYWYSEDKYWCGGQLYTDKTWLWRHGNGVLEKTGPKDNSESRCTEDLVTVPIIDSNMFGPYTWSQLYTLPTDTAALKPKLMTDFGQGGGPTLFEDVEFVLDDTPAPPVVRAALFKVDASIPGVKVVGYYTDPLGRTGTALQLGRSMIVVDPASGAVIDETDSGSTVMYVTQGPATSEPKLSGSAQVQPTISS
ncbi:MAG TPA: CU044_5270 family protein [Streptosporangiaceae bacterium]|nr:CU044_5270 family protein [Streptosporangiaceae bacterium]